MQSIKDASVAVGNKKSCSTGRTVVLGLGNILLKDEGIGVHIAQKLQRMPLPYDVEVIDGGTAALDVLLLAQGVRKLVVIDALRAGKEAGAVYKAKLRIEECDKLEQFLSGGNKISLHQTGLIDALAAIRKMDYALKEVVVIGVEPERVDCGLELTDKIKRRVPEIIDTVLKEIEDAIHGK